MSSLKARVRAPDSWRQAKHTYGGGEVTSSEDVGGHHRRLLRGRALSVSKYPVGDEIVGVGGGDEETDWEWSAPSADSIAAPPS